MVVDEVRRYSFKGVWDMKRRVYFKVKDGEGLSSLYIGRIKW